MKKTIQKNRRSYSSKRLAKRISAILLSLSLVISPMQLPNLSAYAETNGEETILATLSAAETEPETTQAAAIAETESVVELETEAGSAEELEESETPLAGGIGAGGAEVGTVETDAETTAAESSAAADAETDAAEEDEEEEQKGGFLSGLLDKLHSVFENGFGGAGSEVQAMIEEELDEASASDYFEDLATPSSYYGANCVLTEDGRYQLRQTAEDGVTILVTFDDGVFPEGELALFVETITDEEALAELRAAIDESREDTDDSAGVIEEDEDDIEELSDDEDAEQQEMLAYDICILAEGEELQPDTEKGKVSVSFVMPEEDSETGRKYEIYHFTTDDEGAIEEAENLDTVTKTVDEEIEVSAETESFSPFALLAATETVGKIPANWRYYVANASHGNLPMASITEVHFVKDKAQITSDPIIMQTVVPGSAKIECAVYVEGTKVYFYTDCDKFSCPYNEARFTDNQVILTTSDYSTGTGEIHLKNSVGMFEMCRSLQTVDGFEHWSNSVTNISRMFYKCSKLRSTYIGNLDVSNVKDMSELFYNCGMESIDLSNWDTSKVTNMQKLFSACSKLLSIDLSAWNTQSVTNMSSLFSSCWMLQRINLENWKTQNVTSMDYMFYDCPSLRALNITSFNTSKVKSFHGMFDGCMRLPNIDISSFDVSKATDFANMFASCNALESLDLSHFFPENASAMSYMFSGCTSLSVLDVSHFNSPNLQFMTAMFAGCTNLAEVKFVNPDNPNGGFNTSACTDMSWLFSGCESLISNEAKLLDLRCFDVSHVQDMNHMFYGCTSLVDLNLYNFNTEQLHNAECMFANCENLQELVITQFDTYYVYSIDAMFENCSELQHIYSDGFRFNYEDTESSEIFKNCKKLVGKNGTTYDESRISAKYAISMEPDTFVENNASTYAYFWGLGIPVLRPRDTWFASQSYRYSKDQFIAVTINPNSIAYEDCEILESWCASVVSSPELNITCYVVKRNGSDLELFIKSTSPFGFKLSEDAACTFDGFSSIQSLNLTAVHSDSTTDMTAFFRNCRSLEWVEGFEQLDTSKVTSMTELFADCQNLSCIEIGDTSAVTDMKYMFAGCNHFPTEVIAALDTSSVKDMSGMFLNSYHPKSGSDGPEPVLLSVAAYTEEEEIAAFSGEDSNENPIVLNLTGFDTRHVTHMNRMFEGAGVEYLILGDFNTASVQYMESMFRNCYDLKAIISEDFDTTTSLLSGKDYDMFSGCESLIGGNGTKYSEAQVSDAAYARVDRADVPGYFSERVAPTINGDFNCNGDYGRSQITRIVFTTNEDDIPEDAFDKWNCGETLLDEAYCYISPDHGEDACSQLLEPYMITVVGAVGDELLTPISTFGWFKNYYNLLEIKGLNLLNTEKTVDMEYMFYGCENLKELDLSHFDTERVISMYGMFDMCGSLRELDLSSFETGNVVSMQEMFYNCDSLTSLDLSGFDTAKVEDMSFMFAYCYSLKTLDIPFDTYACKYMDHMFIGCSSLQRIYASDFSRHSLEADSSLFDGCESLIGNNDTIFNQDAISETYARVIAVPFDPDDDSTWGYFTEVPPTLMPAATWFDEEISPEIIRNLRTIKITVDDDDVPASYEKTWWAETLDSEGAIDCYLTKSGSDYDLIMYSSAKQGIRLSANASGTFGRYSKTSGVLTAQYEKLESIEGLELLDTSAVTDMSGFFAGCPALTKLNIRSFDMSAVTNIADMFHGCSRLETICAKSITHDLDADGGDNVFAGCVNLVGGEGTSYNAAHVDASYAVVDDGRIGYFTGVPVPTLKESDSWVRDYEFLKDDTYEIRITADRSDIPRSYEYTWEAQVDTSDTDSKIICYFEDQTLTIYTTSEQGIKLSENAANTFGRRTGGEVPAFSRVSRIDGLELLNTANTTNMSGMFGGCYNLQTLDVSGFDTSKVISMNSMFYDCRIRSLDLSSFRTGNVTNMDQMFYNCSSLETLDLSGFNTQKVTSMSMMFANCQRLSTLNLSSFDTGAVRNFYGMFASCSGLETIYSYDFDHAPLSNDTNMFGNCILLEGGLGTSYRDTGVTNISAAVVDNGTIGYFTEPLTPTLMPQGSWYKADGYPKNKVESIKITADPSDIPASYAAVWEAQVQTAESDGTPGGKILCYLVPTVGDGYDLVMYSSAKNGGIKLSEDAAGTFGLQDYSAAQAGSADTFAHVKTIEGLGVLDYSETTDLSYFFAGCAAVEALNVARFQTGNVSNMEGMFAGCGALTTIYSYGFDTGNISGSAGSGMFADCVSLVGEKGTAYSADHTDESYAVADNGTIGYFTRPMPVLKPGDTWYNAAYYDYKYFVNEICITNDADDIPNADDISDASAYFEPWEAQTADSADPIICYLTFGETEGSLKLTMYTPSEVGIKLSPDASSMFGYAFVKRWAQDDPEDWWYDTEGYAFESLQQISGLELLDTLDVTDMSCMFAGCEELTTLDLSGFSTANVTDMSQMFYGCWNLTDLDVSSFDTSAVTSMESMFESCQSLQKLNVSSFDTSGVTSMEYMFASCYNLQELDVSGFDTSGVISMASMFESCQSLQELDLSSFNTGSVKDFGWMFWDCPALTTIYSGGFSRSEDIPERNEYDEPTMEHLFGGCISLVGGNGTTCNGEDNTDLSYARLDTDSTQGYFTEPPTPELLAQDTWFTVGARENGISKDMITSIAILPGGASAPTGADVVSWTASKAGGAGTITCYVDTTTGNLTMVSNHPNGMHMPADASNAFRGFANLESVSGLDNLNTDKVTNMQTMFAENPKLTAVDLSGNNLSKATDLSYLFYKCPALTAAALPAEGSGKEASSAENVQCMFYGCESLRSADVSTFADAPLTTVKSMFNGCKALASVNGLDTLDTSGVTTMANLFNGCAALTSADVSNFDTNAVTDMSYMFAGTGVTRLDLSHFDTSNVTRMTGTFMNAENLKSVNIRGFDISNVTSTSFMFYNCPGLETIYSGSDFNTDKLTACKNMFYKCTKLKGMNGTSYTDDHAGKDYARIDAAGMPGYFTYDGAGSYYVNFAMGGYGTQIRTQSVAAGAKAAKPEQPSADGVTFANWYADAAYSTVFDFDRAINANTTIYVKWVKNSSGGGSGYVDGYMGVAVGIGGASRPARDHSEQTRFATAHSEARSSTLYNVKAEPGHWFWRLRDNTFHYRRASGEECANGWFLLGDSLKSTWYHFDANGVATSGWYKNELGDWYYLEPKTNYADGGMVTGWRWIKDADGITRCYYFEERATATQGAMYKSGTTRDGYELNDSGAWIVNGVVQTK